MNQKTESSMTNSASVEKQLDELEEQNAKKVQNKKGSTNEIQPMSTDEGLTQ
jgi:hypothetical protein